MNLSRILCSSESQQDESVVEPSRGLSNVQDQDQHNSDSQQTNNQPGRFTFVPDKERKRPYLMSARQRQSRSDHEAYKSRVENLTLEINDLRQQIRCLLERRELHCTRLLLQGQHYGDQVIHLTWKYLASLRSETHGLVPSEDPNSLSANCGVQQFEVQRGRTPFTHRHFIVNSVRVLDGITTAGGDASRIQQVTGGVCVVEVLAIFTGRIRRETIVSMCPHVLSDEPLMARIIGQAVTFSPRLLLYFDTQQQLVRQIVQADILAAIIAT